MLSGWNDLPLEMLYLPVSFNCRIMPRNVCNILNLTVLLHVSSLSNAFSIVEITPPPHSLTSARNTSVTIAFDSELNPASVSAGAIHVFGHWSGVAVGTYALVEGNKRVRFTPSTLFNAGEWVCVTVSKSVQSLAGENLTYGYSWHFWIKPSPGTIELVEMDRISVREPGEGHIQTYGAHGGDLNHDGLSDFFVPNEISNDCRVFMNDGTGRYSDFDIYPIQNGARPSTNESADFNGDGHLDLAVGNSTGDSITVFLGDGTGSFLSIRNYKAASGIRGLAVADMDGDGDIDIVTANRTANNITILQNLGDGSFGLRMILDANSIGETACATADANGDGILDLFVGAHGSGEISVLLGDGESGFMFSEKTDAGGDGTWMVAVGDLNGDGNVDVACVNSQSANAGIIFGDGNGGLSSATAYPTGGFPIAIDLGDIDGDGDLDLMTSNYSGGNWAYWENDGTGAFINRRILDSEYAGSCATFHDRDNDGDLDMTGIDEEADLIIMFENTGPSATVDPVHSEELIVYPNPSHSGWIIDIQDNLCHYFQILDMQGHRIVRQKHMEHGGLFIPASTMNDGVYTLQLLDSDNRLISSHKIILMY